MTSLAIVDTRLAALDTPYALKDTLKAIGGARWNAELKAWTYPVTPGNAAALAAILPKADRTPGVEDLLSDHLSRETAAQHLTTDDVGPVPWAKLPPWRHQARAYHFARERKAAILALDMGTGKSAVVTWLVAELAQADVSTGDPRVLITCPLSVVGVWPKQFELHSSIPVRVVPLTGTVAAKRKQAESECSRSWGMPLVLVVNHESLWRTPLGPWVKGRGWDMLVVDECFIRGTQILTPTGDRNIEDLRTGDLVIGIDHKTGLPVSARVTAAFNRFTRSALTSVGDGAVATCNHPVWSDGFYRNASSLSSLDTVCCIELKSADGHLHCDVRVVRQENGEEDQRWASEPVLRQKLLSEVAYVNPGIHTITRRDDERAVQKTGHYGQDAQDRTSQHGEAESAAGRPGEDPRSSSWGNQPVQQPSRSTQGCARAKGAWIRNAEWRQREAGSDPATDARSTSRVGDGVPSNDEDEAQLRVPDLLQNRHCRSGTDDRDRGGRRRAPQQESTCKGLEEGEISGKPRMEDPPIHQQGDPRGSRFGGFENIGGCTVFNLETETGNYVAGGVLVHNCHRGKAPGGKLSLYLSSLRPLCRYRIGLTGTLMPHSPLDVYAQARAIDPDVFGTSFTRFRARYAVMGGYGQHQVLGFQNQDDLAAKLAGLAYQVRAGDVLDLPDVQHITRPVELSPAERRVYRDLEREMVAQVEAGEITVANALVKLLRLQQATSGYAVTDDDAIHRLGTSKRDVLADVLEDLPQREPVVVFCRFHHDLDSVHEVVERQGRRYGEVSGRTKDGLAPDATMRPDLDVLGVQIQSGGVGVDLTRSCYAIYFSTGFSLGEVDQSRARVHRPGQTRTTFYYHLVANGTVDEDVISAINEKRDVVESVLAAMRRGQPRQARG